MDDDNSFTGTCPTCGQKYCGAEIERLRAALKRIDALNDNPARFNSEINKVVMQALEPSSHQ